MTIFYFLALYFIIISVGLVISICGSHVLSVMEAVIKEGMVIKIVLIGVQTWRRWMCYLNCFGDRGEIGRS